MELVKYELIYGMEIVTVPCKAKSISTGNGNAYGLPSAFVFKIISRSGLYQMVQTSSNLSQPCTIVFVTGL